jgi:hypothetical protein
LAILGQKSLDQFKNTIPVQKLKILSLFVSKGQRVSRVFKNHKQKVLKSKNNRDNREVSGSSPNNQKFVKQLIEGGAKILHVQNHVDLLKASDGERSVQ